MLSLFLSQRRPAYYLQSNRDALKSLTRKHTGALGTFEGAAPTPAAEELDPVVAPIEADAVPQPIEADLDTDAIDISQTRVTHETLDVPEFLR